MTTTEQNRTDQQIVTAAPTLRQQLHAAIDLAQNPGGCRYSSGCVVAKFFSLHGFDVPVEFDKQATTAFDHPFPALNKHLDRLQELWDWEHQGASLDDMPEIGEHRELLHSEVTGFEDEILDEPVSR